MKISICKIFIFQKTKRAYLPIFTKIHTVITNTTLVVFFYAFFEEIKYQNKMENQTVIINSQKSPSTAALLGIFFGPLGMFYSTITGAIVMFFITGIVAFFTVGFGLIITQPICAIWAYSAAKKENNKAVSVTSTTGQASSNEHR